MKVLIGKPQLEFAIKTVMPAVAVKATLPVLEFFRLTAENDELTVAGTDLECLILKKAVCSVHESGGICLPAKLLAGLVSTFPNDIVQIKVDEGATRATITCGTVGTKLPILPVDEFPGVPLFQHKGDSFSGALFALAIDKTQYAAYPDATRPVVHSINIASANGTLTMAATDGFRLAIKQVLTGANFKALVYAKVLKKLSALCQNDEMYLHAEENKIIASGTDWLFTAQLVDGTFPDYAVILPRNFKTRATVEKPQLKKAIQQVQLINGAYARILINGQLTMDTQSEDTGEIELHTECQLNGPEVIFAINPAFLMEAVNAIETDQVEICANAANQAIVIKMPGRDDAQHVIMPLSLIQR